MAKTEPVTDSPSDEGRETNLIPLFGAASNGSPDENISTPTWDSADEVGVSDLPSTIPVESSRSQPLGDFGFTGTFLSEEIILGGSLEIKEGKVTLWASGTQLATWNASDCKVQRIGGNRFSIEADEEVINFTADNPEGLAEAIEAHLKPLEQASDREGIAETGKPSRPSIASATVAPRTSQAEPVGEDSGRTGLGPMSKPDGPRIKSFRPKSAAATAPTGTSEAPTSPGPVTTPETFRTEIQPRSAATGTTERIAAATTTADPILATPPDTVIPRTGWSRAAAPPAPADDEPLAELELATAAPRQKNTVTIADRITATAKRRFTSAKAKRWQKDDLEQMAIKVGVIAAAIGILTLVALTILILAGTFRGEPGFVPVPTTTIPRAPTTTVVVTTLPPPPTTLFQTDVAELTERWNYLAEQSRPELALFNELTSPFLLSLTPAITLEGLLDPVAGSVVLRATPTGTSEGDAQILTALGLLIGISDPTLDGPDRRALLETLGLKIQDPQLGGLDGTLNYNGLTYHLAYLADQGVIELRVTPEIAGTTTTTSTAP